jgi:hypothetical protein
MKAWISRFLSRDDLWSVLGYCLMMAVSRLQTPPLALSNVSLLASGMITIVWIASPQIRARNLESNPNARVMFWAAVSIASILLSLR